MQVPVVPSIVAAAARQLVLALTTHTERSAPPPPPIQRSCELLLVSRSSRSLPGQATCAAITELETTNNRYSVKAGILLEREIVRVSTSSPHSKTAGSYLIQT